MSDIRDVWLHAHHVLRSARHIINQDLRPFNLSSAEGNILLHLFTQGQGVVQENLVEQLDVTKPAISRALHSLETKGYIARQRDAADRRAYRVWLTDAALAIGPAIEQAYNHVFSIALQDISQAELAYFMNLFHRISDNLEDQQANDDN